MTKRYNTNGQSSGYYKDGKWVPVGPMQRPSSPFVDLRLKRSYQDRKKSSAYPSFIQVQKRNIEDRWVSLGDYDTEDEAVEALEFEAEVMDRIEDGNNRLAQ